MSPRIALLVVLFAISMFAQVHGTDLVVKTDGYSTAGLFTKPLLPHEDEDVTITVRVGNVEGLTGPLKVLLEIVGPDQTVAAKTELVLPIKETVAESSFIWRAGKNGLYRVAVLIDPENKIEEVSETNNSAELVLPVLKKGIVLHLPWQHEMPWIRWATCIGSANSAEQRVRLNERGIMGLHWEYAGASWNYYEKKREESDRKALLKEIEQTFYSKFSAPNDLAGYGMDETICEPSPDGIKCQKSIASMKGLLRARSGVPGRFYLVWHAGTIHEEIAQFFRDAADLVALEKYVFRNIAKRGMDYAYKVIDHEVENLRTLGNLIEPKQGQICHTVIAFDTSERPDLVGPGEMEQVVRYLRQVCPEMHGVGWYNGGYGSYLLKQKDLTPVTDYRHEQAVRTADRLSFDYFIKPCITLDPRSLKLDTALDTNQNVLSVTVRNIGGMDSGSVVVSFRLDDEEVAKQTIKKVPASHDRSKNRVVLRQAMEAASDTKKIEAVIVSCPGSTILNARVGNQQH